MNSQLLGSITAPLPVAQKLTNALANEIGVKAFLLGVASNDTQFTYQIRSEQKLAKSTVFAAGFFIRGFIQALT